MPNFSLDENGNFVKEPASVHDFCNWANTYQSRYFTGPAPDVKIAIVDDTRGIACFVPAEMTAYIDRSATNSEKFSKIALLHEMVHINLFSTNGDPDGAHGHRFKVEIKRLMCAGAYDNLL